ncbi:von Willebrand and RING finger domain containing protein [Coccidioides immitis RMSCC 3703]|uniref:von Willebrand and RING finger domain containing protein n=1 Tax=Coccidioides immitis RMSCC 3703 TaxID=454286 RepID=A0A0J8R8A1_COCIT|nr:von Willebrand and RING finger domain containing protein [Coccidioides immitis RMSCC 3703]
MMDVDRSRSRRERTFVGSECAVCEEPLEHTLRGERILQFSCAHVSHEACFYEYIKECDSQYCPTCSAPLGLDSSRGGNLLDLEKLSNLVRSVSVTDTPVHRNHQTPTPSWDVGSRPSQPSSNDFSARSLNRDSQHSRRRDSRDASSHRERIERLATPSRKQHQHVRNDSEVTGTATSGDYSDTQQSSIGRRHDYDVQAMESALSPRPGMMKNPIPAPIVTVRSEFPTLNRSRQQQSLTCLVTIEVPDGKMASGSGNSAPRASYPCLASFGKLRPHGRLKVGKDRRSWQELECYLFSEMLICIKEKKSPATSPFDDPSTKRKNSRCTLKGSILIKKHLKEVETVADETILTLNLSVNELPCFHLQFQCRTQLDVWKRALLDLHNVDAPIRNPDYDVENSGTEEEDYRTFKTKTRVSSTNSSYGAGKSAATALTDYTNSIRDGRLNSFHVPLDIVVVIPVSSSMQGLKITLLRDTLRFLVQSLGPRDRMGLVTFGSSGGGVPLVGMTTNAWGGWNGVLNSIRPVGQKSLRADLVEGANVAMDLLMQRKSTNPLSSILLISDSSTSDPESVDFVISRAEAAKVGIYTFGLGMTHKPDTMIELSSRTKASYMYVKDWMMLRECVAGCLGSLQTTSHQNVKLKLRLPEGSPARFVKISGALHTTKRATGRDAEAALGDLRFGDKRDILVQLAISPDNSSPEHIPQDPWESIVSGLEALGGPLDGEDQRVTSIEEVPLIQADVTYGDILRDGHLAHSPRPSLLAITMLPASHKPKSIGRPITPPIPPHPSIVQRRMELLTSDMLTRALTLVSRGQQDRAHHLLTETRSILKGLGKGSLPPLPTSATMKPTFDSIILDGAVSHSTKQPRYAVAAAVIPAPFSALDADSGSGPGSGSTHPAVFGRDFEKGRVLQANWGLSRRRGA